MTDPQPKWTAFRQYPAEIRRKKFDDLRASKPDRIPVIFEVSRKSKVLKQIDYRLTFRPKTNFAQILQHFRKEAKLDPSQMIFFHCGKMATIPPTTLLEEAYSKYKNPEDGFLYIECCEYEAWGGAAEGN